MVSIEENWNSVITACNHFTARLTALFNIILGLFIVQTGLYVGIFYLEVVQHFKCIHSFTIRHFI